MTYLVDANVLSEATKPAPNAKVIEWLSANEGGITSFPNSPFGECTSAKVRFATRPRIGLLFVSFVRQAKPG